MTEPVEGELLPALRDPPPAPHGPLQRHATCHYEARQLPPWRAFCGATIATRADTRRQDLPKCAECLAASTEHAQQCDCFHLFPGARLPR